MKFKSDSFQCFKLFRALFEKTGEHVIPSLNTDNGGEYVSSEFESYLLTNGIKHVPGPPHTPQLNGVAERANRTIGNLVRCSLISASLPKLFWVDSLRNSFHAYNAYPCNTPQGFRSPNSVLRRADADMSCLHPFGCLAWYKLPEANRKKLEPKARSAMLLSYLPDGKGYRLWDLQRKTVIKSRDVIFEDVRFPYGASLVSNPEPIRVELPIPPAVPFPARHRPSTPELPLLDIQLEPRFDRSIQASIHNPANSTPSHNPPRSPPPGNYGSS